ncbi:MAG: PAS-domain containing protein [Alphaproteobacteria bacterium]|nr:PAS-domain containing protein [Alphaproteobacteria bacterium]
MASAILLRVRWGPFAIVPLTVAAAPAAALPPAPWSSDPTAQAVALATIVAAWLAVAVWSVIRASRAREQANIARHWGLRLRGLLSTMPEAYLIVDADGTATGSDTLRGWLGLDARIAALDDLAVALGVSEFAGLRDDIQRLTLGGDGFSRFVVLPGTGRVLVAQGRPAPAEVAGERGVVVWFRDATDMQATVRALEDEKAQIAANLRAGIALFDSSPTPVWRRGPDLSLVAVNAAYARAVAMETPEAAVTAGAELAAGVDGTIAWARRARDENRIQVRETAVIIGDERRVLQITDVPMGNGEIGGFAIDVTDREEARAERDRLVRSHTDTLNRLSAGVALFGADKTLAFYNRAFSDLFALEEAFLEERPEFDRVFERMREARRLPESRDFPSWRRERRAWFTSAIETIEEMWALPDSAVVRVIAQPHPDGGLLLIFEDRTEQLRLASSRDTLIRVQQATLNNLFEGVAVFGADGRIQLWNEQFAKMWQFEGSELARLPTILDMLTQRAGLLADFERAKRVVGVLQELTTGQRREARSARVEMSDGRTVDFAAVPLPDGNALFTYVDVTDSVRIETALRDRNEALEAADRLKTAFVANISYELRTPLTAISGFSEMLAAGYAGSLNERQADYVQSILSSSNRLELLINDILDLATNEAGELALDRAEVPVEPLLRSVAAVAADSAGGRGLTLAVDAPPEVGSVEGDERRLKQLLNALINNAVRFTPPGGAIQISAVEEDAFVRIIVADTGIGVPEGEQELVFDRFRKGSNAPQQGTGLGLALVRQFAELHGGTVSLDSRLGEGTTVTVDLPRRLPPAAGDA